MSSVHVRGPAVKVNNQLVVSLNMCILYITYTVQSKENLLNQMLQEYNSPTILGTTADPLNDGGSTSDQQSCTEMPPEVGSGHCV